MGIMCDMTNWCHRFGKEKDAYVCAHCDGTKGTMSKAERIKHTICVSELSAGGAARMDRLAGCVLLHGAQQAEQMVVVREVGGRQGADGAHEGQQGGHEGADAGGGHAALEQLAVRPVGGAQPRQRAGEQVQQRVGDALQVRCRRRWATAAASL